MFSWDNWMLLIEIVFSFFLEHVKACLFPVTYVLYLFSELSEIF